MENKDFDVALSFAGEDRAYAKALADVLILRGLKVFYDEYEKATLWGKDLYVYLSDIYQNRAMYCVIFVSQHYSDKMWTNHERKAAQARALMESKEYILPVRLDNSEVPGILETTGYLMWSNETPETIAGAIVLKLNQSEEINKTKLSQTKPIVLLRSRPMNKLSNEYIQYIIKQKGFFDANCNSDVIGLPHEYEVIKGGLVIDHITGLTWQISGSPSSLNYTETEKYIRDLNNNHFAGHGDWRLPTLEEAMSLLGSNYNNSFEFSFNQLWIWTSDKESDAVAWVVALASQIYYSQPTNSNAYVRAVR